MAGRAIIVDFPPIAGRKGASILENPGFTDALAGKGTIGKPQLGAFSQRPVLPMGVPLKGADGTIRAVLIGISALDSPDFLERIFQGRIGETGGFLLISPSDHIFVAAGDPLEASTFCMTAPCVVSVAMASQRI